MVEISGIFHKNDYEKHMEFSMFFNMLFHHLFAKFAVFCNARNLQNSDFPQGNAYFHKISFFALDAQRRRKTSQTTIDWEGERAPKINEIWMPERNKHPLKNWWFLISTSRKNVKKSSLKRMFFSITFLNGF